MKNPKIRFKGYTDDWEWHKLEDMLLLLKDGTHGTHANVDSGIYLLSAKNIKNGCININESDRQISLEEYEKIHTNFQLMQGDVLMTIVGTIGDAAILENPENITFQRSVAFLRTNENLDNFFLVHTISTKNFQKELDSRKSISAQPGIYLGEVAQIPIMIPKEVKEQKKIGAYFSRLDNLITLHQQKCEETKILKRYMLQKMFPQNGTNIPEIRFNEFTDAWEQCKFGDCNDLITGYPFESEKFTNQGIKLVRGMNVKRGYLDFADEICMWWDSSEGLEKFLLENNDILIQMDGALIGKSYAKIKKSQLPALLVQRVTRARTKRKMADSNFMYQTIQRDFLHYITMNKTETAVPHLSLKDIREFKINVPSLEEQQRIGGCFNAIDHLINLHQRKCDELQSIKKFMLQNMFV